MQPLKQSSVLAAAIAAMLLQVQSASAQFIWDGDCSVYWNDCCNTGTPENPEWRNNWTIAPSPNGCPNLPGPNDDVTVVKTVIMQNPGASTWLRSLTITSTIDDAVHFTSFNDFSVADFLVLSGNIVQPATWAFRNGPVQFQNPDATMTISSFATLDLQTDGSISAASTALLTNNGLILKSVGGDASLSGLSIPVENNNTIRAMDGLLVFFGSLSNNGLIEALPDTEIRFQGPALLDGEVRGDGLIRFVWTSTTVTGDYHPTNTLVAGGGAIVNFEADTSIENLTLGNSGSIGGSADLTIDDLVWNGGYSTFAPGGTTVVEDTMLIQHDTFAGGGFAINRDMELHGDSVIEGAAQVYIDDSELRNDGELQMLGGSNILQPCCTPDSVVQNFGTLRKVSGGPSVINVAFLSIGDVAVESGELHFDGEMTSDGPITVNAGALLGMGHQQQTNHLSGSIAGEGGVLFYNDFWSGDTTVDSMLGEYNVGTTTIQAGTMSFDTDGIIAPEKTTGTLNLIQGFGATRLQGNADLIVTDQLNWSSGEMAGTGTTFVHGPMVLNFVGYWQSLSRTLELNVDAPIGKAPPTSTLAINPLGTLRCRDVTIDGHINNNGVISPGTPTAPVGQLHLTGGYTQTAGGQLTLNRLGPAHDQLLVDGLATLSGTLNASGFPPSGGQSFTILTAADVQGTFAQVNAPSGMQVIYTPTSVMLQSAPGMPCPADIAPSGGDGHVNIDDLLAVISAWGACPMPPAACPANIVNSGASANVVNIDDLLAVISAWGACP